MKTSLILLILLGFKKNLIAGITGLTKTPASSVHERMKEKYPRITELARNYRHDENEGYDHETFYRLKLLITPDGTEIETNQVRMYLRENDKDKAVGRIAGERTELYLCYKNGTSCT